MKVKEMETIFKNIQTPWKNPKYQNKIIITDEKADLLFKLKYGEKTLLSKITEENYESYLKAIGDVYIYNWNKYADLYLLEYDPIENYNRTDTETTNSESTTTPNIKDEFIENNRKESIENNSSETNENKIYGFNSSEATNSDMNTTTNTAGTTTTHSGGNTTTRTGTETNNGEIRRQLQSKGNIGVTTTQQMAEQEIELWEKMNIVINYIFEDLKNILTIPIY